MLVFGTLFMLCHLMDVVYQFGSRAARRNPNTNTLYNTNKNNIDVDDENSFAVVINTYKRPDMLRDAVQHYGETCGRRIGVAQVFIVWAELQVTPPSVEELFRRKRTGFPSRFFVRTVPEGSHSQKLSKRSEVSVIRVPRDSLNSRFLPIDMLKYSAVFMVDDDIRVDCNSLEDGFQAWKVNPLAMVGYYPRLAAPASTAIRSKRTKRNYVYQAWPIVWWRHRMNFVLTKASFLHAKYLAIYSDSAKHPVEVLDYVDRHKNCEDVAMALLVTNATATVRSERRRSGNSNFVLPMIYVEGVVSDKGVLNGISTQQGGFQHMNSRSKCLDDLSQIYENHGWLRPLDRAFSLRQASWIQHVTSWHFRPSNVLEWGALENIFK